MRTRSRYRRRERDLAFPLVVCYALALWALWPGARKNGAGAPTVASTRVRFVELASPVAGLGEDAVLFFADAHAGMLMDEAQLIPPSRPLRPQPRVFEAQPPALWKHSAADGPELPVIAARSLVRYQPASEKLAPYQAGTGHVMRAEVALESPLRAAGFALAPGGLERMAGGTRPWELTFEVTCGGDGRTRDVLLLDGVLASGTQSNVVRELYGASARPGAPVTGRLTVRWGRSRVDQVAVSPDKGKG